MAKYKVGDKVQVISNPVWGHFYKMETGTHGNTINTTMGKLAGEVVTISSVWNDNLGYSVAECSYNWTDGMFKGLVVDAAPEPEWSWEDLF